MGPYVYHKDVILHTTSLRCCLREPLQAWKINHSRHFPDKISHWWRNRETSLRFSHIFFKKLPRTNLTAGLTNRGERLRDQPANWAIAYSHIARNRQGWSGRPGTQAIHVFSLSTRDTDGSFCTSSVDINGRIWWKKKKRKKELSTVLALPGRLFRVTCNKPVLAGHVANR